MSTVLFIRLYTSAAISLEELLQLKSPLIISWMLIEGNLHPTQTSCKFCVNIFLRKCEYLWYTYITQCI